LVVLWIGGGTLGCAQARAGGAEVSTCDRVRRRRFIVNYARGSPWLCSLEALPL